MNTDVEMEGYVGSRRVRTSIGQSTYRIVSGENVLADEALWLICFQRVSKRLKTCDLVLISGSGCVVQTTSQPTDMLISELQSRYPVYFMGLDPLPWKRWAKEAVAAKWSAKDWQHLLSVEDTASEQSSDEDYVPESSDDSDDDYE